MLKLNGSVNVGFCQGFLKGPIKVIGPNVACLRIQVIDKHVNPKTKVPNTHMLNFIIKDELAVELLSDSRYDNLILVSYHLGTHFRFNNALGIGRFETQLEIDGFCYKENEKKGGYPYLNRGFYQCVFLGVTPVINANGIYTVDTVVDDQVTGKRKHLPFTVFGSYGEIIERNYSPGQELLIEYKLERSKNQRDDGGVEFFTNCIVEKIV